MSQPPVDPRTPVVAGVGQASERLGTPGYRRRSPVEKLAAAAAADALADTGADPAAVAGAIDTVAGVRQFENSVPGARAPLGRSDNYPRSVAGRIGASPARAVLEVTGGQAPQHLVNEFAAVIADGGSEVTLIFGSEAISTIEHDAKAEDRPDFTEHPGGSLEDRGYGLRGLISINLTAHGLTDGPSQYALIENARRARLKQTREEYALAGIIAGQLRRIAPEQEDIWSFSPFIDLTVYRMIRRNLPRPRVFDWQIAFFVTIVGLRFLQTEIWRYFPNSVFSMESPGLWLGGGAGGTLNAYLVESAIYLTAVMVVGTELKIFNSVRIQIKLEEQERLLLQARMTALQNQINPHFLFNTLNSISSLVRFDPDTAREMILKLATILRRILHSTDSFVPLREEVEFIDNYLDIEVVRFGRDKLKVVKDLDAPSLEAMVPSMLLQPLVENCIKHGLAPKIEGGSITLRSRLIESRLVVEVEDDGVGMGAAQLLEQPDGLGAGGIGMANVAERLKVLYGDTARMTIENRDSGGTLIRLRLPYPAQS